MAKSVKEQFGRLKSLKHYVVLATVASKSYQKTNLQIVKHFTEVEKIPGVYVSVNMPCGTLQEIFEKNKIDSKMIVFIDATIKRNGGDASSYSYYNGKFKKTRSCLFIGSPENLTDISIAMDQAVRALPSEKFVFFDSLNTLLFYNKPITVARFIHFLSSKMRIWKVRGIIVSLTKSNKELISELMQFCDARFDF